MAASGGAREHEQHTDLVADGSRSVGFLDVPDLEAGALIAAFDAGFDRLEPGAVLTAYCTGVDPPAMAVLCARHGIDVVHSVGHAAGTTFVLRRGRAPE